MGERIQNIGGNIPTLIVGWAVTIILFIAGNFITGNRAEATEQKEKDAKIQEQLNSKADIPYVDKAIRDNNAVTLTMIEGLVNTMTSIDNRTQRMETIMMTKK